MDKDDKKENGVDAIAKKEKKKVEIVDLEEKDGGGAKGDEEEEEEENKVGGRNIYGFPFFCKSETIKFSSFIVGYTITYN